MTIFLFATISIPKLCINKTIINTILNKIFNVIGEVSEKDHEVTAQIKIDLSNQDKAAKNYETLIKLKDVIFSLRMCEHGFTLIKADIDDNLFGEVEGILRNHVLQRFKTNLLWNESLFEYEKTVARDDLITTIQSPPDKFGINQSDSHFVYTAIEEFNKHVKQRLKTEFETYKQSITPSTKEQNAKTLVNLYKIFRGYYLRLFYMSSTCTILDSDDQIKQLSSDLGHILEENIVSQESLITYDRSFQKDKKTTVYVIAMDIKDFTVHFENNFGSDVDEESKEFKLLSDLISTWLHKSQIPQRDYWVKCTGDGYFIAFSNSKYPYELAKEIQNKENKEKLEVRIGIHVNEIYSPNDLLGREEIIGPGINYASRVMSLADAGHILMSYQMAHTLMENNANLVIGEEIGKCIVKHGKELIIYNAFEENNYGNSDSKFVIKKSDENKKKYSK